MSECFTNGNTAGLAIRLHRQVHCSRSNLQLCIKRMYLLNVIEQDQHNRFLTLKITKLYWLIGSRSKLSLINKMLIYKVAIKPTWTYGIQVWGRASTSNVEILERFQSKALRMITSAPWYVSNTVIHHDLQSQQWNKKFADWVHTTSPESARIPAY
jgi:hypothetical protein